MLNPATAQSVIDHALSLGADFAELFVEKHLTSSLNTISEKVKSVDSGIDFGIGLLYRWFCRQYCSGDQHRTCYQRCNF